MNVPFVDLFREHKIIEKEIIKKFKKILKNSDFILGEELFLFEKEFAEYSGARFAVGVSSGTDALYLSLLALGVGKGDEVITASNTFIATVYAILYTGAKPVLVDCEEKTYTMDVSMLEKKINKNTKAIIPVHLYGHPANMEEILKIAKKYNLKIVEDAAQATGAEYRNKKVGTFGDTGVFSFYPSKNLGACGDGGMIITDDQKIYEKIKIFRNYGQKEKYKHIDLGFNHRLDTLQAAILRIKLKYLDMWNSLRREIADEYRKRLQNVEEVVLPFEEKDVRHVYHLFVIRANRRDKLREYLLKRGISTGIHYPVPVFNQPVFKNLFQEKFPLSEKISREIISLPMFPLLKREEVKYVAEEIKKFYKNV